MSAPVRPTFAQALRFWLWLGCVSFGGPAGQIAIMQQELVDRHRWIDQTRFLHALNFCMMLPGPEAQQLATFVGWRLHGIAGGLAAGLLFVLPGVLVLLVLSWVAAAHGDLGLVQSLFRGIKPVVVAIIIAAVWRIGRRTLKGPPAVLVAAAAFAGLYFLQLPFPLIVAGAALIGALAARAGKSWFALPHHGGAAELPAEPAPQASRLIMIVAVSAILWALPVAVTLALAGPDPFAAIATLFTKAAFVTFGGAYAVLPYIARAAVETYGWLSSADMINGLALAETTPGPLILVTQYVGFFAGWHHPGTLSPGAAGTLGALLAVHVTFLPCFLFIFAGAPYVERLIHNRALTGALTAITAAVVGVILNLGVFLGTAVLLPDGRPDPVALLVMLTALTALVRANLAVHWAVLAGAVIGLGMALL